MSVYNPNAVQNGVLCVGHILTLNMLRVAQIIELSFIKAVACDAFLILTLKTYKTFLPTCD
jgi:hypothetical protein